MRLEEKLKAFNTKISEIENLIKIATDKVSPLREKNIENLSRIQEAKSRTSKFR
jgi:chromosome segregation protein